MAMRNETKISPAALAEGQQALALPAVFVCAAAVVWCSPERGFSVALLLGALCASPFAGYLLWPHIAKIEDAAHCMAARHLSDVLTLTLVEVCSDEERLDRVLAALSDAIRKALTNSLVKQAMRESLIEALRDDELQREVLSTLTSAVVMASSDRGLRDTFLGVTKDAVTEALKDEGFMAEMLSTITSAAISCSRNRELRDATLGVVKEAVTDALKDDGFMQDMLSTLTGAAISASRDRELREALTSTTKEAVSDALKDDGFMQAFRQAMCESLKDSNIYRSAAAGVVSSLNIFAGSRSRQPAD